MLSTLILLAALHQPFVRVQDNQPVPETERAVAVHCLPRELLIEHIKPLGGEPLFAGIINSGAALEVWHKSDLWLVFVTQQDRSACIIAQGRGLSFANPPATSDEPPAPPSSPPGQVDQDDPRTGRTLNP